jgi:hypothetical protein
MKYLKSSISFALFLLLSITSCQEVDTVSNEKKTEPKACCKENDVCTLNSDTSKIKVIELGSQKSCCAKKEVSKCCETKENSVESSDTVEIATKNKSDSVTISFNKKADAKVKYKTSQPDTAIFNNCLADCVKPCCSKEVKKTCELDCKMLCCSK